MILCFTLLTGCKNDEVEETIEETTTSETEQSISIGVSIGDSESDDDEWIPIRSYFVDHPIDGVSFDDSSNDIEDATETYELVDADTDSFNNMINKILLNDCTIEYEVFDGISTEKFTYCRKRTDEFIKSDSGISVLINSIDKYYLNDEAKKFINYNSLSGIEDWYTSCDTTIMSVLSGTVLNLQATTTIDNETYDRYELFDEYQQPIIVYAQNQEIKFISYNSFNGENKMTITSFTNSTNNSFELPKDYKEVETIDEFYSQLMIDCLVTINLQN